VASLSAEQVLNRNPNLLLISQELGTLLAHEHTRLNYEDSRLLGWKKLVGSTFMGLAVKVVSNKGHEYLELFEEEL